MKNYFFYILLTAFTFSSLESHAGLWDRVLRGLPTFVKTLSSRASGELHRDIYDALSASSAYSKKVKNGASYFEKATPPCGASLHRTVMVHFSNDLTRYIICDARSVDMIQNLSEDQLIALVRSKLNNGQLVGAIL